MKIEKSNVTKKQNRTLTQKRDLGCVVLMLLFLLFFCIPVFCANPTPSLSHTPSNPSKSGCCILSGESLPQTVASSSVSVLPVSLVNICLHDVLQ